MLKVKGVENMFNFNNRNNNNQNGYNSQNTGNIDNNNKPLESNQNSFNANSSGLSFNQRNSTSFNNQNLKPSNNTNNIVNFEALQKVRQDLIGEFDAIIEYDNHIHSSNVNIAKETWEDIRNEELVHIGELLSLMLYLAPYQKEFIEMGAKEFEERLKNMQR